jgi:hypothetical protein
MYKRLKFNIDSLVNDVFSHFPEYIWESDSTTFLDPAMGGGQFVKAIENILRMYGHSNENIKSRVFGIESSQMRVNYAVNKHKLVGTYISTDILSWETDMKFDVVVVNPPYKGGLHIEIFNKSFDEELADGGDIICIQPATPYINRKPTKDDTKTVRSKEIISEYESTLTLVDGNKLFNAGFFVPLSITHVQKVKNKNINVIYSHIDENNKEIHTYDKLDDIFIHGDDIVLGIRDKIFSKMNKSLEDGLYRNGAVADKYYALCRYSGHPPKSGQKNVNPDFYQLIYKANEKNYSPLILNHAREKSEQKGGNQFNDFAINKSENVDYFHSYLLTKFARFAVSIYKISATLDCKELSAMPYMDFSQEWTDEKLFDYFELTQEERDFINTYIPNWYERDFVK